MPAELPIVRQTFGSLAGIVTPRSGVQQWQDSVERRNLITLKASDIAGFYDRISRCHAGANLRLAFPERLSTAEQALVHVIQGRRNQWSSTTCTTTTTSSSPSQPLPPNSGVAALQSLVQAPPLAIESRKTFALQSLKAQIEEEDRKAKPFTETDPLQTIPEFVVVEALPYSTLKSDHTATDDYNIAHFKQTVTRKLLSCSFPEWNLECLVMINSMAPDFFAPKHGHVKGVWTVETLTAELEAIMLSTDEWWKANNIRHVIPILRRQHSEGMTEQLQSWYHTTRADTTKSLHNFTHETYFHMRVWQLPWELIRTYLDSICSNAGKMSTAQASANIEALHSRISEAKHLTSQSEELVLKEVIDAGLLDGDVRGITGLPTHRQLGIVGFAVLDGAVTDKSKIVPLIKEVKDAKDNEDWQRNIPWNYNAMVYGERHYADGLVSLETFLSQCVFTLEECHTMKLVEAAQKEKWTADICFLSPSLHGQNFTSSGLLEQLTANGCLFVMISTQEEWPKLHRTAAAGLCLLQQNVVLLAPQCIKVPFVGPGKKKGTLVALMQFYCRDGLQQHFTGIHDAFKGNTMRVNIDERLIQYLPAASHIEPMLGLSVDSFIEIIHCLYSIVGDKPHHLLQIGFDSGFNLCALSLRDNMYYLGIDTSLNANMRQFLKVTLTHEVFYGLIVLKINIRQVHLHCWGRVTVPPPPLLTAGGGIQIEELDAHVPTASLPTSPPLQTSISTQIEQTSLCYYHHQNPLYLNYFQQ
ncbi:hypothetical protein Pelo_17435 [Pelomyxa schiedti]|nr:hypothetical protein Pelo_17435 [Pelomyxa schiedti]